MFKDREDEQLGVRQKRWLDYLWYYNDLVPPKTCYEYGKRRYSKWEDVQWAVCPIDHRSMIKGEQVIEFDMDNRTLAVNLIGELQKYFNKEGAVTYIQDHNGRSPHLHIFNAPKHINLGKNKLLKSQKLDLLKYNSTGLCREVGGTYMKNDGKKYLVSHFENVESIEPITDPKKVSFPCLNLR